MTDYYAATFASGKQVQTLAKAHYTHAYRAGQYWGFCVGGWHAHAAMENAQRAHGIPASDGEVVEAKRVKQ